MKDRFEWLMDPCDWYLIWDNESDAPAICGQEILGCATAEEAARLAASMNAQATRCECVSEIFQDALGAPSKPQPLRLVSGRP